MSGMTMEEVDARIKDLEFQRKHLGMDDEEFVREIGNIMSLEETSVLFRQIVAENQDLRRQLEVAQAERDAARAEMSNARTLLGDPVGVDIAVMGLLTEIAKLKTEIDKRDKWAWDVLKTPILTGIDVPELLRDLDMHKAEMQRLLVDNAKMRFYIVELEAASRTIDMQLAQQAAREKYEAAFGEQADRPVGVDSPGQSYCQLPEGHGGPHDH